MGASRVLIVNADDFGLSPAVNAGVIEAHERGIVTSASLMVHGGAAAEAAESSRQQRSLALGLHIDLAHWEYVDGEWAPVYERVPTMDSQAVSDELNAQLEQFRRLMGCEPTHLDSHQHLHLDEPLRSVALGIARERGIPLRGQTGIRFCGDFYGQTGKGEALPEAITAERLMRLIERLPVGVTELGCHPGCGVNAESTYQEERERELLALCDPRVRRRIESEQVELRSFSEVPAPPA